MTDWWDTNIGDEGDLWHRTLIDPPLLHLVGEVNGMRLLDLACGNGYLSRRFARQGATVTAVDANAPLIERARAREAQEPLGITYHVADTAHLWMLEDGAFELVVCNMALMDIENAAGAIQEVARVLRPKGRLVASLSHPCFVDILPMGKPRGRPPSRVGFPASRRRAWLSFRPPRSYGLSTGSHGKPCRQNVLRCVDITIMGYATLRACPVTNIKRQGVENMPTIETALRGGIPLINLDKGTSIPLSFVFELPYKLTPSHIRDGFRKCVVFDHILDVQTLDAYDLVLTYDLCRELVLIITPPIGYPGMDTSDLELSLATVFPTFLLLSMSSLSLSQFLFILGKVLGVAIDMTITGDNHTLESQVKPDLLIHSRQMLDIFLYQDRHKVALSIIFGDGNGRRLAACGQRTRPVDSKGCVHLCKREG